MAPTASGSAQETAPLLSSRGPTPASSSAGPSKTDTYQSIPTSSSPAPAAGDYSSDSEEGYTAAALLAAESERKDSSSTWKWLAFWMVFSVFVGVLLVQAVREGGGEFDWKGALKKAGGGGLAGAMAMVIQVLTLMPLRTVMNYQYRYGGGTFVAISKLYTEGGYARYYAGLGPALFQGPIARFGDTAANAGILALLSSNPFLNKLPSPVKTAFASLAAAGFRMILVPLDTLKTTMQTQGSEGVQILRERIKAYGIGTLWYGAWATAAASFVGSFPWFATYNYLQITLPPASTPLQTLARQALIGFISSVTSDTISNSLRVLKTYRQVNRTKISYQAAARAIIRTEGLVGLFGRGLKTRILANGLQGIMFSILWKFFGDWIAGK